MDNVHQHSDEIKKSRARPRTSSASSRATRLNSGASSHRATPDLLPLRGKDSSAELRPVSAGHPSKADDGTKTSKNSSMLPPINAAPLINPPEIVDSSVLANTMAAGRSKGHQYPRVLGFKRELSGDEESVTSETEKAVAKAVSFSRRESSSAKLNEASQVCISDREVLTVSAGEGEERVLVSMNCQTEWSWLEDMRSVGRTPSGAAGKGGNMSVLSKQRSEAEIDFLEEEEEVFKVPSRLDSRKSERLRTPRTVSEMSRLSKYDTTTIMTDMSDVTIPPPFAADDTYGIPLMVMSSSDSDLSDDDMDEGIKTSVDGPGDTALTLPSIGPPQILQYNRESENLSMDENLISEEMAPVVPSGGIFDGMCEFCGMGIKPFPSLEEQKIQPPEELYCCADYRQFVNFMLSHPLHEKFNVDKLIDITPHPPHGSKQARRAAKERAAQRMRERELARQQAAMAGMGPSMGGGGGAGGGGGGPSNFYQFARQMKTINYQLSSQKCLEEGWTVRPPSPVVDAGEEIDVFEPEPKLPHWATKDSKDKGLVQKFYEDGSRFLILFPDGTGTVYYPSGRVAIHIFSVNEGLYSYLVFDDNAEQQNMLGVFDPDGHATSYYQHGVIRICLDPYGGIELDPRGFRKRRWSWKEQVQHVHAPPIQPITFAISQNLALRIMSQDAISLTFKTRQRSCRFQVGTKLKLVAPENVPPVELDEDMWFRQEVDARIQDLFARVSNLLKFPKSPKVSTMPSPNFISSRLSRIDREREMATVRSARMEKEKTTIIVN